MKVLKVQVETIQKDCSHNRIINIKYQVILASESDSEQSTRETPAKLNKDNTRRAGTMSKL